MNMAIVIAAGGLRLGAVMGHRALRATFLRSVLFLKVTSAIAITIAIASSNAQGAVANAGQGQWGQYEQAVGAW